MTETCAVNELIQKRWSPRAFRSEPIEPEELCGLFEAALPRDHWTKIGQSLGCDDGRSSKRVRQRSTPGTPERYQPNSYYGALKGEVL